MSKFTKWKSEVTGKLAKRGVPYYNESLASAWGNNYSADYAASALTAEWLCNQPKTTFNQAERCGCFRCGKFFSPDEIVWEDGIAECPHCGMDAVLPELDDYPLTEEMLNELAEKQFG